MTDGIIKDEGGFHYYIYRDKEIRCKYKKYLTFGKKGVIYKNKLHIAFFHITEIKDINLIQLDNMEIVNLEDLIGDLKSIRQFKIDSLL